MVFDNCVCSTGGNEYGGRPVARLGQKESTPEPYSVPGIPYYAILVLYLSATVRSGTFAVQPANHHTTISILTYPAILLFFFCF